MLFHYAALSLGHDRTEYQLSRSRMGRPRARRSSALRVPYSRRRTGRAELDHHFEKTGELSKGVRWISAGENRSPRQTRCSTVAARRGNRAEPAEDRGHHRECEKVSRRAKGIRHFRRLPVELRRRQANPESLAHHG